MTRSFWPWMRRGNKSRPPKSNRPKPKRFYPQLERLEIRWLPASSISLSLLNDTSGGLKISSDGRLTGSIMDQGGSVNGKTITFTSGVTGSTTTNLYTVTDISEDAAAQYAVRRDSKGKRLPVVFVAGDCLGNREDLVNAASSGELAKKVFG